MDNSRHETSGRNGDREGRRANLVSPSRGPGCNSRYGFSSPGAAETRGTASGPPRPWSSRPISKRSRTEKTGLILAESAKALLKRERTNAEALYWLGVADFHQGDFEEAKRRLEQANAFCTDRRLEFEILLRLAQARMRLRTPNLFKAEVALTAALDLQPKNPDVVLLLGQVLEKRGKKKTLETLHAASKKGSVTSPELESFWHRVFVEAPRRDEEEGNRFLEKAREALAAGDHLRAVDLGTLSAERLPSIEADLVVVEGYLGAGKAEVALELLEEVSARRVKSPSPETDSAAAAAILVEAPDQRAHWAWPSAQARDHGRKQLPSRGTNGLSQGTPCPRGGTDAVPG